MWNPMRRKAMTVSPAVLEAQQARQLNLYQRLGGTNQRVRAAFTRAQSWGYWHAYRNSPSVRAVIDLIVENVAQLDLRLYEEMSEDAREARPDHPAAASMREPNPGSPPDQLIRDYLTQYLVYDNAYMAKFRSPGGLLLFQVLPTNRVEIVGQSLFSADGYIYHRPDGTQFDIKTEDVVHWRGSNGEDPRMGLSRLETLRDVIAEEAALRASTVELAQAGLSAPGYVYRPLEAPGWTRQAAERFEEDLYSRRRSPSRPPVLEEGMELRNSGVSPSDAQILEQRRYVLAQVATMYHVPLSMVGLSGGQGDIEQGQAVFYADTLPPVCEALSRVFNLGILQDEYGLDDYCFEFNIDEKQMGNERLKSLVSATGRPVLTTNEGRAMVNKPPIKNGDELVTPQNVVVGENPKPSPQVMPIQDPNGPPQDGGPEPSVPSYSGNGNGNGDGG